MDIKRELQVEDHRPTGMTNPGQDFRVVSMLNTVTLEIGQYLSVAEVQSLIDNDGYKVKIVARK